jgi:hypothetical protein
MRAFTDGFRLMIIWVGFRVLNIKTSKIFLGAFGGTLREHKILRGISKNETPIGVGMGVSFSRRMGISFCKMSRHFFSCDTQSHP